MVKEDINYLYDRYLVDNKSKKKLNKIILPIISHSEFRKRMTNLFPHHGNITLGEHIIEDAIVTYQLCEKRENIKMDLAIKIALFHDLYTIPWQNNKDSKVKHFFHKHGFRHPVEAAINAINWYPEYFKDLDNAKIIIDGILHHMYPLPVMRIKSNNIDYYELKNIDLYNKLSKEYQNLIIESMNRKKVGPISLSKSKYIEGRIMSKADKKVSRKEINDLSTAKSLVTGKNKKVKYK